MEKGSGGSPLLYLSMSGENIPPYETPNTCVRRSPFLRNCPILGDGGISFFCGTAFLLYCAESLLAEVIPQSNVTLLSVIVFSSLFISKNNVALTCYSTWSGNSSSPNSVKIKDGATGFCWAAAFRLDFPPPYCPDARLPGCFFVACILLL